MRLVVVAAQAVSTALMLPMMEAMQGVMAQAMDPANVADPVRFQAIMAQQQKYGLYGLIGWIAPGIAIYFGIKGSTDGPNRYGATPVRF